MTKKTIFLIMLLLGLSNFILNAQILDEVNEVLNIVNRERIEQGLYPLVLDEQLTQAAQYKSDEMHSLNYYSHSSPTYGRSSNLIKMFYTRELSISGENIAKGQTSGAQVMNAWMNSSGHRANILRSEYRRIGIGYNSTSHYWTQVFTD